MVPDAAHRAPELDIRGVRAPGPPVEDKCGLVNWLKENGGRVLTDAVEVADMEVEVAGRKLTRRGVRATRAMAKGEEIVYVPEKLMITNFTARATMNAINWLWDKATYLDDADIVTLFLLYESQDPNSFFKPYICSMPKTAPQPSMLDKETLASFKAAFVRKHDEPAVFKMLMSEEAVDKAIKEQRSQFESRYTHSLVRLQKEYPEVFPAEKFTREKYFWAYGMLSSRSFAWVVPGVPDGVYAMMPFADLPNRDRSKQFQQLLSVL
jgi:hypothetical protein